MARTPNTEARRAEITRALLTVIAQHGYERATIQSIAAQAGLAPGLIHYHFKSKQEILVSLIEMMAGVARARYERILGDVTDPGLRLDAYLEARLGTGKGAAADVVAAWVMIGAEAVRQEEVRVIYGQVVSEELALLTALLEDCLREQQRDTRGASTLAAAVLAMMEGAFQLSSATSAVMPVGYAAAAAKGFVRMSILAAPMARQKGRKAK
ncbi:MAG: TetR/AcrR family transcriptional regulator [Aquabacterium sp.]|nr:MAG: TetR/AcrR family transcriptional regulator [Aquabacterium sp.]